MDLQTLAALAIVALCGVYIALRWVRFCTGRSEGGCHSGGCSECVHNRGCVEVGRETTTDKPAG